MDKEIFLHLTLLAIKFFKNYAKAHELRIASFKSAVAATRGISFETSSFEYNIIKDILAKLDTLIKIGEEPTEEHCYELCAYLEQAEHALKLQVRNVNLAFELVPVPPHKHGAEAAKSLFDELKLIIKHKSLEKYLNYNKTIWHTPVVTDCIDFSYLLLINLAIKKQIEKSVDILKGLQIDIDSRESYSFYGKAAANDAFYNIPPNGFTLLFDKVKSASTDSQSLLKLSSEIDETLAALPPPKF